MWVCYWAFPKDQTHLRAYQKVRHNNRSWKRRGKFQAHEQHPRSLSSSCSAKGWGVQSTPRFWGSRKGKGSQEARGRVWKWSCLSSLPPLLKLGGIQTTEDWTQKPTATVNVTWCLGDVFPPYTDQNSRHITDAAMQPSTAEERNKEPARSFYQQNTGTQVLLWGWQNINPICSRCPCYQHRPLLRAQHQRTSALYLHSWSWSEVSVQLHVAPNHTPHILGVWEVHLPSACHLWAGGKGKTNLCL